MLNCGLLNLSKNLEDSGIIYTQGNSASRKKNGKEDIK